jgi:hypothetical protein
LSASLFLSIGALFSWRPPVHVPFGERNDKNFINDDWGDRFEPGERHYREAGPDSLVHLHGLHRDVAQRVRIVWRNVEGAADLGVAVNGRRSVYFRSDSRFREDRFDVPPAPENCLLIRLYPPPGEPIEVREVRVEPATRFRSLPLLWLLLAAMFALSTFLPRQEPWFYGYLALSLGIAYVSFIAWRPFDHLYGVAFHRPLVLVLQWSCLGLAGKALLPSLERRKLDRPWLAPGVLLVTGVVLTYAHTLHFGFVWDDFVFIGAPRWGRVAASFKGSWMAVDFLPDYYRPLVIASHSLDSLLYGDWAPGFHLTNLLLLAGCALALYRLLLRFAPHTTCCLAAAMILVMHPFNHIAASWISQRTDSLAALFYLSALAASRAHPLAGALFAGAAFLSKEMAVTLPAALLLLDVVDRGFPRSIADAIGRARRYAPLLIVWAAYVGFVYWRFTLLEDFAARFISAPTETEGSLVPGTLERVKELVRLTLFAPASEWLRALGHWGFVLMSASGFLALSLGDWVKLFGGRVPPAAKRKGRKLILAGAAFVFITSLPIYRATGLSLARMGLLLTVGASFVWLGLLYSMVKSKKQHLFRMSLAAVTFVLVGMCWQSFSGSLDYHKYSRSMVERSREEYRRWSAYLPPDAARVLWLHASGRIDHGWPIYRQRPPEEY